MLIVQKFIITVRCELWDWAGAGLGETETSIYAPLQVCVCVVYFFPHYWVSLCIFACRWNYYLFQPCWWFNRDSPTSAFQLIGLKLSTTMSNFLILLTALQFCFLLRSSLIFLIKPLRDFDFSEPVDTSTVSPLDGAWLIFPRQWTLPLVRH